MQLNPLIQLKTTDVQPEGGCVDALQIDAPDSVGSAEDGFGRLYSEEALQDAALGTETFSLNPWSSLTDSSDAMPVQPSDVAATGFSFVLGELNAEKEAIEEKEEGLSVESKVSVAMLSGKDAERLDIAESDFGTDSPDSTEDLSVQTIPNLARTESEVVQLDAQTGTVEFVVKDADREDQVADWENGISSSSRHVGTGGLVMISSRGDKARIAHVTAEEVSDTRTASVADMPTIASPLKQDAGEDGGRLVRVQMNRSANESVAVDAFTAVVSKQTELLDAQQSGITGSAAASVTPMMLEMSRGLHKVLSAADKPAPPYDAKEAVVLAAQTKGAFSRQMVMAETKDMPEVSGRPTTTVTTTEPLLPNSGGSDGKTASVATIQPQSVAEGFAGNTLGGPVSEKLMASGSETFPALPPNDRKAARSTASPMHQLSSSSVIVAEGSVVTASEASMALSSPDEEVFGRIDQTTTAITRDVSANSQITHMQRTELPANIAGQIAEAARHLPDRPVEVSLSPEELGRVKLSFQVSESGALTVVVQAEKPDTAEMMRRNIHLLQDEFAALGYEQSDFQFSGQSGDGQRDGGNRGRGVAGGSAMQDAHVLGAPDTKLPVRVTLESGARMDMRL